MLRGKKLIVHRMKLVSKPVVGCEGGELVVDGDCLRVGCGDGTVVELVEVQMEGKNRMGAAEFLRGYQVRSGERLGL